MKWEAKLVLHRDEYRIAVYFEKNIDLIARIKLLEGSKWSQSNQFWHLPDTEVYRKRFGLPLKEMGLPSEEGMAALDCFKRYLESKRYSASTISTYCGALKRFLIYFKSVPICSIDNEAVIAYTTDFILKGGLSSSFQNQTVNSLKLFFRTIENKSIVIEKIHRPRREKLLPNVLSKEEIKLILEVNSNIKHKAMLSLIYS